MPAAWNARPSAFFFPGLLCFPGYCSRSRRPSRCGSGPKKGDAAGKRHPRTCRPCKPGSVPGANPGPLSFISGGSLLPSQATYPPASGEQPLIAGIHGLATRETYCRAASLPPRWALTPPFHPYPPGLRKSPAGGRSLLRSYTLTDIKSLACAVLCVARTFLSRPRPAATGRACPAKVIKFGGFPLRGCDFRT